MKTFFGCIGVLTFFGVGFLYVAPIAAVEGRRANLMHREIETKTLTDDCKRLEQKLESLKASYGKYVVKNDNSTEASITMQEIVETKIQLEQRHHQLFSKEKEVDTARRHLQNAEQWQKDKVAHFWSGFTDWTFGESAER